MLPRASAPMPEAKAVFPSVYWKSSTVCQVWAVDFDGVALKSANALNMNKFFNCMMFLSFVSLFALFRFGRSSGDPGRTSPPGPPGLSLYKAENQAGDYKELADLWHRRARRGSAEASPYRRLPGICRARQEPRPTLAELQGLWLSGETCPLQRYGSAVIAIRNGPHLVSLETKATLAISMSGRGFSQVVI